MIFLFTFVARAFSDDPDLGPNLFPAGLMAGAQADYVPWAGVDANNNIHGLDGQQLGVNDNGTVVPSHYGPSAALGDLRGTGLQDLVLADSAGFFWYFPNSGTPEKPVFTQGEVIPIWLGEERDQDHIEGMDNTVPRIQLLDFDNSKKLDILAGVFSGKLFHIPNEGSTSMPLFRPTYDREQRLVKTHKGGTLWDNYMAPVLTPLFSTNNMLDLIVGEGTYSANSIYLLRNTDSNARPAFDEDHMQKIIPGMGLEQLTPAVVDWNNDGKPDIITGDRTGYVTLFLNTSTDPQNPTFDTGTHIRIGGLERLGNATTVSIGDLTNNHLPNLLIGRDDGTVLYALNTGKLGAPDFSTPATPLKGVLPPNYHYISATTWRKYQAFGAPDEMVSMVNAQNEPGFKMPDGVTNPYAMKFSVWPVKNTYFPERYYPQVEDEWREHEVLNITKFVLKFNTDYKVHFWIKGENNISSMRYRIDTVPGGEYPPDTNKVENPVGVGGEWSEVNDTIRFDNNSEPGLKEWTYFFNFRFTGQTTFYVSDVEIREKLH
jgi:hypothetical protein